MHDIAGIEAFMRNCFRARTKAYQAMSRNRAAYRRRFYHQDCDFESGHPTIELSRQEKILSVSPSGDLYAVATDNGGEYSSRSRYWVEADREGWLIKEVDSECMHCRIHDSLGCAECGWSGWLNREDLIDMARTLVPVHGAKRFAGNPTETLLPEPGVQQFMADYFQEQASLRERHRKTFAKFAARFYNREFDWESWFVPEEPKSDILCITYFEKGIHVITSGFLDFRLRYNLIAKGRTWIIREVDSECLICATNGATSDCFHCHGTTWSPSPSDGKKSKENGLRQKMNSRGNRRFRK